MAKMLENDLHDINSSKEREAIKKKILEEYRKEFLDFIKSLSKIANQLYNSQNPDETIAIWKKFSSENSELLNSDSIST